MPRQKGTYRIKGKHNGLSYYSVKDGIGDIFRTINAQMSSRVKTEPAFANTRKYAEEFKVFTSTADAIISPFVTRYERYIKPRSRNELSRLLSYYLKNNNTSVTGERNFTDNGWQDAVTEFLCNRSKYDYRLFSTMITGATLSAYSGTSRVNARTHFSFRGESFIGEDLKRKGFDKVKIYFHFLTVNTPTYDSSLQKHNNVWVDFQFLQSVTWTLGDERFSQTFDNGVRSPDSLLEDGKYLRRLCMIIRPFNSANPDAYSHQYSGIVVFPFDSINQLTINPIN